MPLSDKARAVACPIAAWRVRGEETGRTVRTVWALVHIAQSYVVISVAVGQVGTVVKQMVGLKSGLTPVWRKAVQSGPVGGSGRVTATRKGRACLEAEEEEEGHMKCRLLSGSSVLRSGGVRLMVGFLLRSERVFASTSPECSGVGAGADNFSAFPIEEPA